MLIALLGVASFAFGLFFGGWLAGRGWWKDWREMRRLLEERQDFLLSAATSERDILLKSHEREREMWIQERRELNSRIQAYDPYMGDAPLPKPAGGEGSQIAKTPEEVVHRSHTALELGQLGLKENSDGGVIDTRTGALFESVEDWKDWTADLRKKGLPENLHPGVVQDEGWEAALGKARAAPAAKAAGMKRT